MEPRSLMAADIQLGAVYYEAAGGDDILPNTLTITFAGGAPGTELTQLSINTDKQGNGLTIGDTFFDTAPGGAGAFLSSPLAIVSHDGFQVTSSSVSDGGLLLTFNFSGFQAGERLVFTIDVDEQGFLSGNAVAEGNEFEGSILSGTFSAPHYHVTSGSDIFFDAYDNKLTPSGLDLPPDSYQPPSSTASPVLTAGAVFPLTQIPLPSSIAGTVFEDHNVNNSQDAGDQGLAGVQLALLVFENGSYVPTGKTTVTDASGHYQFDDVLPGEYRVVESQPAGYFSVGAKAGTIDGVTEGTVTTPDIISEISILGGQESIRNDFAEALPGSISGRVHADRNGDCVYQPGEPLLSGVTIELLNANGVVLATTTTDSNGEYSFNGLAPGVYQVHEIQPAGYFDDEEHVGTAGGVLAPTDGIAGIVLTSGTHGLHYDFCENEPASISGRVHADRNGDCVYQQGEPLLSGVVIELLDASGAVVATTTTNAAGEYRFDGLKPGVYSVREIQPVGYFDDEEHVGSAGGTLVGPDTIASINLTPSLNAVHYDFCENEPASISGRVHADRNGDCVYQQGEPLLSGVVIELLDASGAVVATTTTNAAGEYRFDGLKPGVYSVREIQPVGYFDDEEHVGSAGGTLLGPDTIASINLTPALNAVQYDFCENEPASISGRVHADRNGDCVYQEGEPGLAGVVIQLLDAGGNVVATTLTDSAGLYSFNDLPPGVYSVREFQPFGYLDDEEHVGTAGGVLAGNDFISQISLGANVDGQHYDFCEIEPTSISGRVHADTNGDCVYQEGEALLSGVVIQLLDSNGQVIATTTTGADGKYHFADLAPGTYSVREIQPAGYLDDEEHVGTAGGFMTGDDTIAGITLTAGVNAELYDFCEQLPTSIRGLVHVDLNGDCILQENEIPLSGVVIQLLDAQGTVIATTLTGADGRYAFENFRAGVYGVREIQPFGYFDGPDTIGSSGGVLSDNDLMTSISLAPGVGGVEYNFCELPPGTISGYVFQDGPAIGLLDIERDLPDLQQNLNNVRDGVREPGDAPIVGVRLLLADAAGSVLLGADGNPLEAVTDANGFYQFIGLPPGLYTVLQVQPGGYLDGLDTAGTLGGLAINATGPGGEVFSADVSALSPQLLAIAGSDGIALIPLLAGQNALENNFSEVLVVEIPFFIPPETPPPPPPPAAPPPARDPFVDPILPPLLIGTTMPDYYGGGYIRGNTWHLSIIDAGRPRSVQNVDAPLHLTSTRFDIANWKGGSMQEGQFVLFGEPGDNSEPRRVLFGKRRGIPVTGDFDGDGITDVGVFLAGEWFIDLNGNGVWDEDDLWAKLGTEGDLPVTGDWDGDGKTDIGIFGRVWAGDPRAIASEPGLPVPKNLKTNVRKNMPPLPQHATLGWRTMKRTNHGELRADLIDHVFHYGSPGDVPITGDWNGSGHDAIGVFRDGRWMLDVDGNGKWSDQDLSIDLGVAGDKPVVGDFNGDGIDELGVYRDGKWLIDINGDRVLDDRDLRMEAGDARGQPVVGDWNGDGRDQVGVYQDTPAADGAL